MTSQSQVGSHSPASPRLPSPPPLPEVQIGPRSPSPSSINSSLISTPEDHPSEDYGAARRIRPGTKSADMAYGPPLVPLSELDSAFQLQEHLKSLYLAAITSPISSNLVQPIDRDSATILSTPPPGIDRSLWLYELCRFLVQRTNTLIVGFFADTPPCSATECPEMRASEWQYLCAVHDPPKSCCAIDYCCHTLDWAAGILTSPRHFPSRLTLGSNGKEGNVGNLAGGDAASVRQLTNIFRRVYRMFAHAWFQHREVFWKIENQEGLYIFYKTVCDVYNLIPEDNYTIPPEAEGLHEDDKQIDEGGWTRESLHGISSTSISGIEVGKSSRPSSLDFSQAINASVSEDYSLTNTSGENSHNQSILSTGATTRRHKQTPSTGSFVTTIHEGDEEILSIMNEPPFSRNSIQLNATATKEGDKPKASKPARPIGINSQETNADISNTIDGVEKATSKEEEIPVDLHTQESAKQEDSVTHISTETESEAKPATIDDQKSSIGKAIEDTDDSIVTGPETSIPIRKVSELDHASKKDDAPISDSGAEKSSLTTQNGKDQKKVEDDEEKEDE